MPFSWRESSNVTCYGLQVAGYWVTRCVSRGIEHSAWRITFRPTNRTYQRLLTLCPIRHALCLWIRNHISEIPNRKPLTSEA